MTPGTNAHRSAALVAAAGGLLVALGAVLPWLTLYGGLHPLRGIIGPYGQALFASGLACAVAAALLPRYPRGTGRILLGAAVALLGFGSWIAVVLLPGMLASVTANPFLLAEAGPGPWLVMAGASVMGLASAQLLVRSWIRR